MELKTECLTAARNGSAVNVEADGHTMTTEEMDLLADEANDLIADGESDQDDPACLLVTAESPAWKGR